MSAEITQSALQRWAAAPPANTAHSDVLAALIAIGDALRRGLEIPKALRAWMDGLSRPDVEAALAALVATARPEDRDGARRALLRVTMSKGWAPGSIAHFERLAPPNLHERKQEGELDGSAAVSPEKALPEAFFLGAVPDDDVVAAYIHRGALQRYVEGVAARSAAFGEELAQCIDALSEGGETVGEAARTWRRSWHARSNLIAEAQPPLPVAHRRRGAFLAPIALAASLVLVAGGYAVYNQGQKERARIEAAKEREVALRQAELEKLVRELKEQGRVIAMAQAEAASAKSEADREVAIAKLTAAQAQQAKTAAGIAAAGVGKPASTAARPACTCQAGDPLCSCL